MKKVISNWMTFFKFAGMRKLLALTVLTLSIVSCTSSKDEQFCTCLSLSEELNDLSEKMLSSNSVSEETQTAYKALQSKKTEACANYSDLPAEKSKELRSACE